jgi:sec-independent protein translocase protein TatC
MNDLPYPDDNRLDFIGHLEEIRRRIIICLAVLLFFAAISFFFIEELVTLAKLPIKDITDELIFISPTEGFVSAVKICLLTAFMCAFPVLFYHLWAFVAPAMAPGASRQVLLWLVFGVLLFISGILFAYFAAIPAALRFLLDFGSKLASGRITLGKYISFFATLVLTGGIIFEIPVILALFTRAGILDPGQLKKKRHISFIAVLVAAAVITPTQDIVNMLIIAFPMYLLYEAGILISSFIHKHM